MLQHCKVVPCNLGMFLHDPLQLSEAGFLRNEAHAKAQGELLNIIEVHLYTNGWLLTYSMLHCDLSKVALWPTLSGHMNSSNKQIKNSNSTTPSRKTTAKMCYCFVVWRGLWGLSSCSWLFFAWLLTRSPRSAYDKHDLQRCQLCEAFSASRVGSG